MHFVQVVLVLLTLTGLAQPAPAQRKGLDHDDVSIDPRLLEIWPGANRPFCFPLPDAVVRVSVDVYEVAFTPTSSTGSEHRPNVIMKRYLSEAIQSTFPNWIAGDVEPFADLKLEVAIFPEPDGVWAIFTSWHGLGMRSAQTGCALPRNTYRTKDLKAAMDHIVRQMTLGEDWP